MTWAGSPGAAWTRAKFTLAITRITAAVLATAAPGQTRGPMLNGT